MKRAFLDANVLFSAAYRRGAGLAKLWKIENVKLVTSAYAAHEAHANLKDAHQIRRLDVLISNMTVLPEVRDPAPLPREIDLPEKDVPIMQAAICSGAGYLVTGDVTRFGKYYGHRIAGVTVLSPAEFFMQMSEE